MPDNFSNLLSWNLNHLKYIVPEIMVVATFLLGVIFDFAVSAERRKTTAYLCILGLLAALWFNLQQHHGFMLSVANGQPIHKTIYSGMIYYDQFGNFFKFIILLGTVISLLLSVHARELFGKNHGEFYLLLVAVCAGGMFLVSSSNLLMIYLSLETLSILSYAMAGYLRRDRKSAEAGIKYVIYGAMASGIMIFGMSYLYGLSGTLNLFDDPATGAKGIASLVLGFEYQFPMSRGALIAILVMVFIGFLYKIAAVPFHYWSPDVYEGAPTTATGFFSVVPKAAGFAVLIRVLCAFFPIGFSPDKWMGYPNIEAIVGIVAIATMCLGNLGALGQSNVKRMLAYSSIAHAGYMLAGLSVLDDVTGPSTVLFYLVIYLFMNLGAFLVLVALENVFGGSELRQLRGAVRREPVLVVALCIFLFSLTGLPPMAGFIGKYLIMVKLADRGHFAMIILIGLNSVVSLYYYMKIAKAVAIDQPEEAVASTEKTPLSYNLLAVCKAAALLLLFFNFEWLQNICKQVLEPLR
ncbi:MAG TPA: NADH-quinone oxidoreductase subunit N [Planctomycetota bacterium]|nr:NADH-quinone oxidoreductase subunit N [Planctomycetota bacterium]